MTIRTFILRVPIPFDELMLIMTIGTFILRLTKRMMTILGFEDTHDNRANSENDNDDDNQNNDDENENDTHDDDTDVSS